MKKLKLKIQDLENPSILTHREIKNILGGGDDWGSGYWAHTCTSYMWFDPTPHTQTGLDFMEVEWAITACDLNPECREITCD